MRFPSICIWMLLFSPLAMRLAAPKSAMTRRLRPLVSMMLAGLRSRWITMGSLLWIESRPLKSWTTHAHTVLLGRGLRSPHEKPPSRKVLRETPSRYSSTTTGLRMPSPSISPRKFTMLGCGLREEREATSRMMSVTATSYTLPVAAEIVRPGTSLWQPDPSHGAWALTPLTCLHATFFPLYVQRNTFPASPSLSFFETIRSSLFSILPEATRLFLSTSGWMLDTGELPLISML
mmetsp:Transcript_29976/g.75872  ORF Transcript_29976/g.75872 Transcript_29976/m.75872 type:complete len:234 (+) Transcript_29976:357-1058(+)